MHMSTTRRSVTRRGILALAGAAALLGLSAVPRLACAQSADSRADQFLKSFADELVTVINGAEPYPQKKAALAPVIDKNVEVDKIARFCLGRFWNSASPAQQTRYLAVFHQVLLNNISSKLGEYKGVSYSLTNDTPQGQNVLVGSIINRPNAPPANVQWVIDTSSGAPKVVDVIAEGTSLRLTSRSDYASYLNHHGDSIDALLTALEHQAGS
jgi:phospholipid transport system substrate-binding protein